MRGANGWWRPGAALLVLVALVGCGTGEAKTPDGGVAGGAPEAQPGVVSAMEGAPSAFVEREFWLAIADEPGWHLNEARREYLAGDTQHAWEDLSKVAAMLRFEVRHSRDPASRGKLEAGVEEVREVARQIRFSQVPYEGLHDVRELDRVSALIFRALALHHESLATVSVEEGDALMAGRYLLEAAKDLESGFARADEEMDPVMAVDLSDAKHIAEQMVAEGDGSPSEARSALQSLDDAVTGLGEVLGARRK